MQEEIQEEGGNRNNQLSVLCILSFVGGGLSIFSNLLIWSLFDQVKEYFNNGAMQQIFGEQIDLSFIVSLNPNFFLWQIILYSISVYGVILMWNTKAYGFHVYSISQIVLLIIPEIFIPNLPFPLFEILLSLVFILLYYKNLKEIGRI